LLVNSNCKIIKSIIITVKNIRNLLLIKYKLLNENEQKKCTSVIDQKKKKKKIKIL